MTSLSDVVIYFILQRSHVHAQPCTSILTCMSCKMGMRMRGNVIIYA